MAKPNEQDTISARRARGMSLLTVAFAVGTLAFLIAADRAEWPDNYAKHRAQAEAPELHEPVSSASHNAVAAER
jgi:hypothetical protein